MQLTQLAHIRIIAITATLALGTMTASAQRAGRFGGAMKQPGTAPEPAGQMQRPSQRPERGQRTGANAQISPTQQQNIQKLTSDLQAIKAGSQVTPEMKQALKNDLMAMAEGATKPDEALVQKLANDLADALADQSISSKEKAQLSQDLYAVMNSANIPVEELNQAIADAQTILKASGITQQDVQTIASDLNAIATEAKKNHPDAASQAQTRAAGLRGKMRQ